MKIVRLTKTPHAGLLATPAPNIPVPLDMWVFQLVERRPYRWFPWPSCLARPTWLSYWHPFGGYIVTNDPDCFEIVKP